MGAGKTSVGKLLARRLGKTFFDSDHEIERVDRRGIPVIFEIEGEAGFRAARRPRCSPSSPGCAISCSPPAAVRCCPRRTAGCSPATAPSSTCARRRTTSGSARGTIATGRCCKPPIRSRSSRSCYTERDPLYREIADVIVDTGHQSLSNLVHRLEHKLARPSRIGRRDTRHSRTSAPRHAHPDSRARRAQLPDPHRRGRCWNEPELIAERLPQKRAAIVTNDDRRTAVPRDAWKRVCTAPASTRCRIILPDGEDHKNWETLNTIFDALLEHRCERSTTIIALGGGVVGDHRGIRRGGLPARRAVRPGAHDVARAGGLGRGRQDRDQPSAGQEHDRRVLPAARGASPTPTRCRHAAARASSPPASPKSSSTA